MDYAQGFVFKMFLRITFSICLILYSVYNPSFGDLFGKIQ